MYQQALENLQLDLALMKVIPVFNGTNLEDGEEPSRLLSLVVNNGVEKPILQPRVQIIFEQKCVDHCLQLLSYQLPPSFLLHIITIIAGITKVNGPHLDYLISSEYFMLVKQHINSTTPRLAFRIWSTVFQTLKYRPTFAETLVALDYVQHVVRAAEMSVAAGVQKNQSHIPLQFAFGDYDWVAKHSFIAAKYMVPYAKQELGVGLTPHLYKFFLAETDPVQVAAIELQKLLLMDCEQTWDIFVNVGVQSGIAHPVLGRLPSPSILSFSAMITVQKLSPSILSGCLIGVISQRRRVMQKRQSGQLPVFQTENERAVTRGSRWQFKASMSVLAHVFNLFAALLKQNPEKFGRTELPLASLLPTIIKFVDSVHPLATQSLQEITQSTMSKILSTNNTALTPQERSYANYICAEDTRDELTPAELLQDLVLSQTTLRERDVNEISAQWYNTVSHAIIALITNCLEIPLAYTVFYAHISTPMQPVSMPTLFTAIFKLFDLVDRDGSVSLMRICQHAAKLWKDMPEVILGALPVGGVMKFVKQETNMDDILFHTAALQSLSSFVTAALAYQASAQDGIYLDETRLKKVNDLAQLFANLEVRAYVNHFVDSPEQSLAEAARTVTQFIEAH